jgi:predicted dehydrogenase
MLKVAIVGCGKIADEHASQISRIQGCTLVAVCDAEPLMANQLSDRFGGKAYGDLDAMLSDSRPDVVHVTTPPQSHFSVASRCILAGCHVFVEKPFTITAQEATRLLEAANARDRKVTVGHNLQFSYPALRLRALVREGYLGGPAVHLESYFCYDLSDASYARAFLTDSGHWVRTLPGGLLQNIISHGLARIAEYLHSDSPAVTACAFTSPMLRSLGETRILDELRVIICDEPTTAYFTFSSQMRPQVSQFRVFGAQNGLQIDDSQQTLIKLTGKKRKSYLEDVVPALSLSGQYLSNTITNVRRLVTGTRHMSESMKELIERFYDSIAHDRAVPIPYAEILRTSNMMDAIFAQIAAAPAYVEAKVASAS